MNDFMLMAPALLTMGTFVAVPAAIGFALAALRVPIKVPIGIGIIDMVMLVVPLVVAWIDNERGGRASISEVVSLLAFFAASLLYAIGFAHALGTGVFRWRKRGLIVVAPLLVYLTIPLLMWGQAQLRAAYAPYSGHSDAAMLARFVEHEPGLSRLAALFTEDGGLDYLCPDGRSGWQIGNQMASPERLGQYQDLFERTGIKYGATRQFQGQVRLRYWAAAGGVTVEKGYAFLPSTPEPLLESLDGRGFGRLAYRHISGSWYLYYYDSDSMSGPCM